MATASSTSPPAIAWRTVAADSDTVCPAVQTDSDLAKRMPTYGFELDDNDLSPYPLTGTPAGAVHVGAQAVAREIFLPLAVTGI